MRISSFIIPAGLLFGCFASAQESLDDLLQDKPELKELANKNTINMAWVDPDFGVRSGSTENLKRDVHNRGPDLLSILRSKKQQQFCSGYLHIHPKTVTQTVQKTQTVNQLPKTKTVSTTTTEPTVTTTTTAFSTEIDTSITVADAITETTTVESDVTIVISTTSTTTITSGAEAAVTPQAQKDKRNENLPVFLRGYECKQISSACSRIVNFPTTTVTKTHTVATTKPASTLTKVRTVTSSPGPVTVTTSETTTTVTSITSTPPVSLETATSVETTTTTAIATATHTACVAAATPGWEGAGYSGGSGSIDIPAAADQDACCNLCYTSPSYPNCEIWVYSGSTCILVYNVPGSDITDQCPRGHGNAIALSGGTAADGVGGVGPCIGSVSFS